MVTGLDSFMQEDVARFTERLQEVDIKQTNALQYDPTLQTELDSAVNEMIDSCRKFAENSDASEKEMPEIKKKFREQISPWYVQSFLSHRGLQKPRGYPGDYVTLEGVYNKRPLSEGIGEYLDIFFLKAGLAEAIRNRKDFVRDWISQYVAQTDNGLRALNLASGSCREWYELSDNDLSNVELTCLDFDQESLDFSTERLQENSNLQVNPVKDNIIKFALRKKRPEGMQEQDVVYSIGLYDYLPDKILGKVITKQYDVLKEGGNMLIAFKDCRNYDPTMYDWFADWHFVPRTKPQVDDFLKGLGYDANKVMPFWEPSGTIFFYQITK